MLIKPMPVFIINDDVIVETYDHDWERFPAFLYSYFKSHRNLKCPKCSEPWATRVGKSMTYIIPDKCDHCQFDKAPEVPGTVKKAQKNKK